MHTKHYFFLPLLALALVLSACGPSTGSQARTLSVNGDGTVYLTPDIAYINIGVHTEDANVAKALDDNSTQAQNVINALTNMGVATTDIQTSNFSVYSNQKYDQAGNPTTSYTYSVDNTVYVTVRDLTKLGALLNTVVGSGANNISSIQFDVADKTGALAQARQKAMENASALASGLAKTAGVTLGEIQTVSYTENSPSPYYPMRSYGGAAPTAAVPIQTGQLQISVTVSVTYALK